MVGGVQRGRALDKSAPGVASECLPNFGFLAPKPSNELANGGKVVVSGTFRAVLACCLCWVPILFSDSGLKFHFFSFFGLYGFDFQILRACGVPTPSSLILLIYLLAANRP